MSLFISENTGFYTMIGPIKIPSLSLPLYGRDRMFPHPLYADPIKRRRMVKEFKAGGVLPYKIVEQGLAFRVSGTAGQGRAVLRAVVLP